MYRAAANNGRMAKPSRPQRRPEKARTLEYGSRRDVAYLASLQREPPHVSPAIMTASIVLIVAAVVLTFASGAHNEFVSWDDGENWAGNTNIRGFTASHLKWML